MNIRKFIPIIFSISILLILVLGSGCATESSPSQKTQQDIGITQITEQQNRISFEEAKAALAEYRRSALNETANVTTVNYVRLMDVDGSGNATGLIFGAFNGHNAEFMGYDRTGWTIIANATLPSEEIDLDSIVSPDVLFRQNKEIILGNLSSANHEQLDVELHPRDLQTHYHFCYYEQNSYI